METKAAPALPRLNLLQRAAYGAGELGPAVAGSTLVFFQLIFLTNVAGMNPAWAGSVLLVARVWDAINDPLIGWLSDHTRTKWGRRLPWMLSAALPFAVFFTLFWLGPELVGEAGDLGLFLFYSGIALLFSTASTGLALPHSSLTAELSHDYDERSRLTSARMAFSLGGSVGGLILALVVFRLLPDAPPVVQYAVFGACVALVGLLAMAFCLWGIWRVAIQADQWRLRQNPGPDRPEPPVGQQLRSVLQNRPFLLVCGIYLCSWLAMQFTAGVLPFYVTTVMGQDTGSFQVLALCVQGTALLMIPFWAWVALRQGKKPVYFYGMVFWIAAQSGLLFLAPGETGLLFGLALLAGVGISVCYLIPNAMLPDVIEWDELRTGQRREGLYYGFCVFLQKVALAGGTFAIGQILAFHGFLPTGPGQEPPVQPESAVIAIRWLIGPLPAAVLVVGLILAAFYPLSREVHARMVRVLAVRSRRRLAGSGQE